MTIAGNLINSSGGPLYNGYYYAYNAGAWGDTLSKALSQAGTYKIRLTVVDSQGRKASSATTVDVDAGPTSLQLTAPTGTITAGQTITLGASFFDSDPNPSLTASWSVDGMFGYASGYAQRIPPVQNGIGKDSIQWTGPAGSHQFAVTVTDSTGL